MTIGKMAYTKWRLLIFTLTGNTTPSSYPETIILPVEQCTQVIMFDRQSIFIHGMKNQFAKAVSKCRPPKPRRMRWSPRGDSGPDAEFCREVLPKNARAAIPEAATLSRDGQHHQRIHGQLNEAGVP